MEDFTSCSLQTVLALKLELLSVMSCPYHQAHHNEWILVSLRLLPSMTVSLLPLPGEKKKENKMEPMPINHILNFGYSVLLVFLQ